MIYKCKNCGAEYDTFPKYCDCGNNTFDKTEEETPLNKENIDSVNPNIEEEYDEYGEKIVRDDFKISQENNKDLALLYQPDFEYTKKNDEQKEVSKKNLLPIIIFVISLLISFVLVITAFLMPTKNKNLDIAEQQTERIKPKTADVNDFWDNTPNFPKENTEKNNVPKQNENVTKQTSSTAEEKKSTTLPVQKPVVNKQKPVSEKPKTTPQKPKTETKVSAKSENKMTSPVKEQPQAKTESKPKEIVKPVEEKPKETVTAEDKAKLNTYKANLRQALFSVFPILNVQGSGTASVAFSISSDGKLLNRRFVSQSDNKSLNDAMYHMLMKMPSYRTPPSAYKGEDFILEMKFNNGRYSFSYLK